MITHTGVKCQFHSISQNEIWLEPSGSALALYALTLLLRGFAKPPILSADWHYSLGAGITRSAPFEHMPGRASSRGIANLEAMFYFILS